MTKLIEFKPTIAKLKTMAKEYGELKIKNKKDKLGYVQVETALKDVKKTRISITKTAKEIRSEAIRVQREVIAKEKDAKAIIQPVEEYLQIEKLKIDNEEFVELWQKQMADVGQKYPKTTLLKMTEREFTRLYKLHQADFIRKKQEAEQQKKDEEAREKREKQIRKDEQKKFKEREKELEQDKKRREKELKRLQKEKEADEKKKKAEAELKEKNNKKYKQWLENNKFNPKTDKVFSRGESFELYRIVSTLDLK